MTNWEPDAPAQMTPADARKTAEDVLAVVGLGGRDDLPRAAAAVLELLLDLDAAGVFGLNLAGLPDDLDARFNGLALALRGYLDQREQLTSEQLAARRETVRKARRVADRITKGATPDGLTRRTALLVGNLAAQLKHGQVGGLLWQRLDEVADALAEVPTGWLTLDQIRALVSRLDELDEPSRRKLIHMFRTSVGKPAAGDLVELNPAAALGESVEVPRGSVAAVVEWVGEDPGRARAALGVEYGGPYAPREDVVELLNSVVERAGECVAVWNAHPDQPCPAAAGPGMPHRCVAKPNGSVHRRSIVDHACACGSTIAASEVAFELAERVGLTYEPGRPGELPMTLGGVRAFNPVDADHHPVGYLLVVGELLPHPVRHELWQGDEFVWLKRDLARRNEVLARAVDYSVPVGSELRLALFDEFGHRVCHGVTVAEGGVGLPGGRATVRGVAR